MEMWDESFKLKGDGRKVKGSTFVLHRFLNDLKHFTIITF